MIEQVTFDTLEDANVEKKSLHGTWRALHTDFINDKVRVTFVNGEDDPANSQEVIDAKVIFERKKALKVKLQDDSMTFDEMKEYMRLT